MEAPSPALNTVRGFHGTPMTSDDDSDAKKKTPKKNKKTKRPVAMERGGSSSSFRGRALLDDVVSANCSPVLRASGAASPAVGGIAGGIAKLRMQMEPFTLDTSAASSRASSPGRKAAATTAVTATAVTAAMTAAAGTAAAGTAAAVTARVSPLSKTKPKSSDTSRSSTPPSSSITSEDDADAEDMTGAGSYVIRLKTDFISESVRPVEAAPAEGIFETDLDDAASTYKAASFLKEPKKITSDDFEPLRCLGKGSYGTVLLVKQKSTGRLYAQKQFKKASLVVHKKLVQQTKTERQILESVNRHPFVVKLFYAFQDHEKLYLILEYGQGGELFTHLSSERMFSEETSAFYMAEMVLALSHLHDTLGVVYRDLKPENCLLDAEGHLLLTDFGLSKVALPNPRSRAASDASGVSGKSDKTDRTDVTDDACCNSILGTVEYMAPEVVEGRVYGRAVDWWSFGALGFDLMTGSPPFRGHNNAKIQENIVKQKLNVPFFLSPDAKDLLLRLLRKEPRKRLGANMPKDLETIKKHRFFRKIDWRRLAAREVEPPILPVITDPELAENFASEFTELALSPASSPVLATREVFKGNGDAPRPSTSVNRDDPFGGFSFVASTSLLNESHFPQFKE